MDMASVAIIRTPSRFLVFLCVLASLTRLTLCCTQDFLDIIGPGVRVKRGPDWKWGDQDGNGLGTLTTEISSSSWITVKWDNGHTNSYRVGHQDKCDLAIVDVLETQCNFFPTNMTDTGDFLLSFQDFPRSVHTQYRCHKHIQSPDETKVVALHILMIDMCNTTIYDGSNRSSNLVGSGCMMVPGTYVSSGRDMFIDTFKKLGTKYGFMAYVTYENKECENTNVIYAKKDVTGFFTSPYSNFTLGSSISCLWNITTSKDQILEITVTFLDDERGLSLSEDGKGAKKFLTFGQTRVGTFTSETSRVTLKYEKNNKLGKGFQILYTTKDKPKEAYCSKMIKILEPGESGMIKLPEYDLKTTGSLNCNWQLNSKSKLGYIALTVTRIDSADCHVHKDIFKANGASFPLKGQCEVNSFIVNDQQINISYIANSPNNSVIILEYKNTRTKEAYCSKMIKTLEPGESGMTKLPEYDLKTTGSLNCNWQLKSKSKLGYIALTVTRIDSADCRVHKDIFKANGASFPLKGRCEANSFTVNDQQIDISYITNSANNSVIILEYKNTRMPFCFSSGSVSVGEGKGFLDVPGVSSLKMKSQCEWNLISPEHQQVSVEVLPQTQTDWEPYNAFKFSYGQTWSNMTERKITSVGNKLSLRFDISKQPSDYSGKVIVTYTAVSPSMITPAVPIIMSSTLLTTRPVECTQPGVPIWCYVVLVLLSLGCVALFITSMTLYRRQIYVCDEHGSLLNLRLQDIIAKDDQI